MPYSSLSTFKYAGSEYISMDWWYYAIFIVVAFIFAWRVNNALEAYDMIFNDSEATDG